MQAIQDVADSFGQAIRDLKTNRGAVQPEILEETALDFAGVRAASLVVLVTPSQSGRLFESDLAPATLSRLIDVLEAVEGGEASLVEALSGFHARALSKYRALLEELEEIDSGLAVFLARPQEDLGSVRLNRDGLNASLKVVRETLPMETSRREVVGPLLAVNSRTLTFEILDEEADRRYWGRAVANAGRRLLGLTIGNRYRASLLEENEIQPVTGELQTKFRLTHIEEAGPQR